MKYWVFAFIGWSSVSEFFIKNEVPLVSWIDEAIVFVLIIHFFTDKNRRSSKIGIENVLIGILIISILSWMVNGGSVVLALQFLFSMFKPIFLFYWIISYSDDDSIQKFVFRWLSFLIVLQIPFFLYGLAKQGTGYFGDYAVGAEITGDAHQIGVHMALGTVALIAYYFVTHQKKFLIMMPICLGMLIITSTKQITLALPLILVILLREQLRLTLFRIAVFLILGIGATYYVYVYVESIFVRSYGVEYGDVPILDALQANEKVEGYYSAIFELPDELPVPLLGAGPGQYGSSTAMTARTPLSSKYIMDFNDLIPENMGGTLTYRSSGIIAVYGDLGIVALLLVLWIYGAVVIHVLRFHSSVPFEKAVSFVAAAAGLLILGESLLQNIFEGNWFILNCFWVLSGCLYAVEKRKSERVSGL